MVWWARLWTRDTDLLRLPWNVTLYPKIDFASVNRTLLFSLVVENLCDRDESAIGAPFFSARACDSTVTLGTVFSTDRTTG